MPIEQSPEPTHAPRFLFSVDVEDPRDERADGERFPARVPDLVRAYLAFLRCHGGRGTFFFVGRVARRHPGLVRAVLAEGHEIGCHSDAHIPLPQQGQSAFRDDLLRNMDALRAAGAERLAGYRAPCFSMTAQTQWAYPILGELGFFYSSSVLPARNPLHGWAAFGREPKRIAGVLELPISVSPRRFGAVPTGGLYFRALPRWVLRRVLLRQARRGEALLSYVHPYDLDSEQPFAHPAFARWSPFGILMRRGRGEVLPRLEMAHGLGFRFGAYEDHARDLAARAEARPDRRGS